MRRRAYLALPAILLFSALASNARASVCRTPAYAVIHRNQQPVLQTNLFLQGSEESSPSQSHGELFKWLNFLIMVGVVGYFLRRPLSDFLADRLDSIRQALNRGRHALEASEFKLREVESKLTNVEREIAAFRADSEREMIAERERLKQSAEVEARRILEFAQVQIEAATRAAKTELKKYAARQAVEQAEALIRARMDNVARERLVGNFVADLHHNQEFKN